MKRFKTGFSLAEVLLTLAIVSIIATIGFTMSRKGIEKAYNGYIYNGYNSLTIAIAEANARGFAFNGVNLGDPEAEKQTDEKYGFCNAVEDVLRTRPANQTAFVGYNIANVFKQFLIGSNGIITGAVVDVDDTQADGGFELPDVDRGDDGQGIDPDWWKPKSNDPDPDTDTDTSKTYNIESDATSNGISYKFVLEPDPVTGLPKAKDLKIPQFTNNNGNLTKSGDETKKCSYILITMDVPAMKYKDNGQFKETKSYKFMYFYETDYPLIPADEDSELLTDVSKLAYTIDDGETGRMINGTYKPRSYYSFNEAACRVYGEISYGQHYLFGKCPDDNTPVLGSMLLVNPVSILH
ncbi:prepilin-type N-terminal cleavage/methylation domain-containing protein [bacterium]|nr:prepilin-type N-terminal cleavage/methylation domain-containing protein [bacterium]